MFIENVGQFADGARFQVRRGGSMVWLAQHALWITVLEPRSAQDQAPARADRGSDAPLDQYRSHGSKDRRGVNLRLSFVGIDPHLRLEPCDRLETTISYFFGHDPDDWRPDVPA